MGFILAIQAIVSFFLSFFVLSCGYMHGCDHIVINIGEFSKKSPLLPINHLVRYNVFTG